MTQHESVGSTLELRGATGLLTRLGLATVATSVPSWLLLFVALPCALFVSGLVVDERLAAGVVPLCGFLLLALWSIGYYQYTRSALEVDRDDGTLTAVQGREGSAFGQRTFEVPLESIAAVSAYEFRGVALLRLRRHDTGRWTRFTTPASFVVPTESVPVVLDAAASAGASVVDDATGMQTAVWRFFGTAAVLLGLPVATVGVFGTTLLATNGALVVALLGSLAMLREIRVAR